MTLNYIYVEIKIPFPLVFSRLNLNTQVSIFVYINQYFCSLLILNAFIYFLALSITPYFQQNTIFLSKV